jgi:sugar phosphate isomerase/epimerase
METIEKLAPFTVATHIKDMAVAPYDEGILMSEVILGKGYLDLPRAITLIRQARPQTRMTLEMITRDPLKIPLLTDRYWATFPEKTGLDLARTLRFVNEHRSPLPRVSHLTKAESSKAEDQNVIDCLTAWDGLTP